MTISHYHAHIYFDQATRDTAAAFRERIRRELAGLVRVYDLIDEPIGPHPLPMFEVDVPRNNIESVKKWLDENRNGLTILVHPLTGNDLADHRDFPQWLGTPQELNLTFLETFKRRG